ncbi:unnamed protein product [Prunus brigantina]
MRLEILSKLPLGYYQCQDKFFCRSVSRFSINQALVDIENRLLEVVLFLKQCYAYYHFGYGEGLHRSNKREMNRLSVVIRPVSTCTSLNLRAWHVS